MGKVLLILSFILLVSSGIIFSFSTIAAERQLNYWSNTSQTNNLWLNPENKYIKKLAVSEKISGVVEDYGINDAGELTISLRSFSGGDEANFSNIPTVQSELAPIPDELIDKSPAFSNVVKIPNKIVNGNFFKAKNLPAFYTLQATSFKRLQPFTGNISTPLYALYDTSYLQDQVALEEFLSEIDAIELNLTKYLSIEIHEVYGEDTVYVNEITLFEKDPHYFFNQNQN